MRRLPWGWGPCALLALALLLWAPRVSSQGVGRVAGEERAGAKAGLTDPDEPSTQKTGDAHATEEIEEIEEITDLGGGSAADDPAAASRLLARLHPLVVHFPIAWVFLLVLVEGIALAWGRPGWWGSAGLPLLLVTLLSAIPAVITGFARAAASVDSADLELMAQHRNAALGATLLLAGALVLRFKARPPLSRPLLLVYLLLLGGIGLLISAVGYLGGELMFGRGHLFP